MDGNDGHSLGEDALARAWAALGQEEALYTRQGERLQVLFPGVRMRGQGRILRGRCCAPSGAGWCGETWSCTRKPRAGGGTATTGPRYRGVVLHVVQDGRAGSATALPHGGRAPVLVLASHAAPEAALARCAECRTAAVDPEALRPLLVRLGRLRFGRKARIWKQRLARLDPAAQDAALFSALIEGLGYGARRPAFRALAAAVSWSELRAAVVRAGPPAALALLLGTAGFLEERGGPALAGVARDALRARWGRAAACSRLGGGRVAGGGTAACSSTVAAADGSRRLGSALDGGADDGAGCSARWGQTGGSAAGCAGGDG